MDGWMGGWMGGWMDVEAGLRTAYSNKNASEMTNPKKGKSPANQCLRDVTSGA